MTKAERITKQLRQLTVFEAAFRFLMDVFDCYTSTAGPAWMSVGGGLPRRSASCQRLRKLDWKPSFTEEALCMLDGRDDQLRAAKAAGGDDARKPIRGLESEEVLPRLVRAVKEAMRPVSVPLFGAEHQPERRFSWLGDVVRRVRNERLLGAPDSWSDSRQRLGDFEYDVVRTIKRARGRLIAERAALVGKGSTRHENADTKASEQAAPEAAAAPLAQDEKAKAVVEKSSNRGGSSDGDTAAARSGAPRGSATPWVPTELQGRILEELDGVAYTAEGLQERLGSICVRRSLDAVKDALADLKRNGRVGNRRGLGYFRPDRPPRIEEA